MKKTNHFILPIAALAGLALTASSANAQTINASWDTFGGADVDPVPDPLAADFEATGIMATISDIGSVLRRLQDNTGNTDGTYGSTLTGADPSVGRMHIKKGSSGTGDFAINITNSTGAPLELDELLFDFEVKSNTHDAYSIVFENITQSTTTGILGSSTGLAAGWQNIDIDASAIILADGENGRFVVSLSGAPSSSTSSGTLDNIAITSPAGPDTTAPTLAGTDIVDDKSDDLVAVSEPVTYTVTFSEEMDALTVEPGDFENNPSQVDPAPVTIDSVTPTANPAVFEVVVTPSAAGPLQLQVKALANLQDPAGNPLDTDPDPITDDTVITVEIDNDPPSLLPFDIVDDQSGPTIAVGTLVTYTLTFYESDVSPKVEDMDDSTVTAADFSNGAATDPADITIGTITETSPGVFTIEVTADTGGSLQFQVNAGANLEDVSGNALDTTLAIMDEDTLNVDGTAPTLTGADIDDGQGGASVVEDTPLTYTVTFNEAMDASTVEPGDFENNPSLVDPAPISIDSVSATGDPAVFGVVVTPSGPGPLQLQVVAGANLEDAFGNALNTTSAIADETIITVDPDTTPPTLAGTDIVDNMGGGPIFFEFQSVTYTVTFNEPMDALTVEPGDFENNPSLGDPAPITVDSVAPTTDPAVFEVVISPSGAGTLQLQVKAGATLEDANGIPWVTGSAISDDTLITVNAGFPSVFSNETFDGPGVSPGESFAGTDYTPTGNNAARTTIVSNITSNPSPGAGSDPTGQHGQIAGDANKHFTLTEPLPLVSAGLSSLEISCAVYFNNTGNGNRLRLFYSALGDFSDSVAVQVYNPTGVTNLANYEYENNRWYAGQTVTINDGQSGITFTDTAKIRWAKQGTGQSNRVSLDDIVIAVPAGNDFSDWIDGFDVGTETAIGDDPDGDGNDNGVENFFDTDPGAFSSGLVSGAVTTGGGSTFFTFTHPQNANPADDLTAAYQWSKDLVAFHPEGSADGTTVAFSTSTDAGITTVTAEVTGTIPDKLFVNVLVTQNP